MEVVRDEVKKQDVDVRLTTGKDKEVIPKIVVCPSYKSLEMVCAEFVALLGAKAIGICLITFEEAIEHELPIRKAMEDYANKIAHPVYLANGVNEMILKDYQDPENTVTPESVQQYYLDNPRKTPERNEQCPCGSGSKYKKCCRKESMRN